MLSKFKHRDRTGFIIKLMPGFLSIIENRCSSKSLEIQMRAAVTNLYRGCRLKEMWAFSQCFGM